MKVIIIFWIIWIRRDPASAFYETPPTPIPVSYVGYRTYQLACCYHRVRAYRYQVPVSILIARESCEEGRTVPQVYNCTVAYRSQNILS
eukprot:scaffold421285_cov56-Attheya_sp.AAC.7